MTKMIYILECNEIYNNNIIEIIILYKIHFIQIFYINIYNKISKLYFFFDIFNNFLENNKELNSFVKNLENINKIILLN